MHTLLSDLTVVIPSYNRQRYALRNMEFWNKTAVQLHVLDGTQDPIPESALRHLNDNIKYHHLPLDWYERIRRVIPLINTDYVIFLSDDEFLSLEGVCSAIAELEKDKSLISCCGHALAFYFDKAISEVVGYEIYHDIGNLSFLEDTPSERLYRNMANFTSSLFYSVTRKEEWLKAVNIFLEKEFTAYAIPEIQFEMAICVMGKTKVIPELFLLRTIENKSYDIPGSFFDRSNYLFKWWTREPEEREELLHIMASHLEFCASSQTEVRKIIEKGFELFNRQQEHKVKLLSRGRILRKINKDYLFKYIHTPLRKIYLRFAPKFIVRMKNKLNKRKPIIDFLKAQDKFDYSEKDVKAIEEMVASFHQ